MLGAEVGLFGTEATADAFTVLVRTHAAFILLKRFAAVVAD
jgi:hypothetical protein